MDEHLFYLLYDKIFIPEVFPEDLDGTTVWAYS